MNYRDGRVPAVGFTAPNYQNNIPAPWLEEQNANDYNNQIVLSFTPNALEGNHTFYTKYVEAFKGPVTDTGQGGLPLTFEELAFAPEYVTGYELGAKGTAFDGRLRYDFDIFRNDFKDLQTVGAAVVGNVQDQNSVSLNAGKQRVDGIEFSFQYAATEHLTLNVSASLLDAKFLQFDGDGCSTNEIYAASIDALANQGSYSAAEVAAAQSNIDALEPDIAALLPSRSQIDPVYFENAVCRLVDGTEFGAGTINRAGVVPQDAPDWKFVLGANYVYPVFDTVEAFVNIKGFISDDYRTGRAANPADTTYFEQGGDMNLSFGLNSSDGSWRLAAYVRNIFEFKPGYYPEKEVLPSGIVTNPLSNNSFTSYGLRMEYNYQ